MGGDGGGGGGRKGRGWRRIRHCALDSCGAVNFLDAASCRSHYSAPISLSGWTRNQPSNEGEEENLNSPAFGDTS